MLENIDEMVFVNLIFILDLSYLCKVDFIIKWCSTLMGATLVVTYSDPLNPQTLVHTPSR